MFFLSPDHDHHDYDHDLIHAVSALRGLVGPGTGERYELSPSLELEGSASSRRLVLVGEYANERIALLVDAPSSGGTLQIEELEDSVSLQVLWTAEVSGSTEARAQLLWLDRESAGHHH